MWGYSILIPGGASGSFMMDEVSVTGYGTMYDFQGGIPGGFVGFADSWDGSGSSTSLTLATDTSSLFTVPAQDGTTVAKVTYSIAASGGWGGGPGYGGVSHDFASTQVWNSYQGLSFWYYGGNSGAAMRIELKSGGANAGASNRFVYDFTDNFTGWRFFSIPWGSFAKRTDYNPGASLGDSINFNSIWGYSVLIPGGVVGTFMLDNVAPYGGGGIPAVSFSAAAYDVNEAAGTATITVNLDLASSSSISVDYATSNGTAAAGTDYTSAAGTLNFAPGDTSKTFTVSIQDNTVYGPSKTVNLALSNPAGATLGANGTAVLTIADDDSPLPFLDNFEGGIPAGFVGFADSWDGSGSSTSLALVTDTSNLPTVPAMDATTVAKVTYSIAASGGWGGGPGYGGVSRDFASPKDLSSYDNFRFWFKGSNSGAAMRVELKSDGANSSASNRFEYSFTDNSADWRYFSIPFASFVKRTDYNPGAGLGDSLALTKMWGYSILIPGGASGSFMMDEVSVTGYGTMYDFQGGIPGGFVGFADAWDGSGSATTLSLTTDTSNLPVVPVQDATTVAKVTYSIAASGGWGGGPGYGGVSHDFAATQNWSSYQGFGFWYYGGNNGAAMRIELKSDGANAGASNRFVYSFTDNFTGWRFFSIPWSGFVKRTDYNPGASLGDSINFNSIWGYSVLIPGGAAGTFMLDNVAPYGGGGGTIVPRVSFGSPAFAVNEADATATITVSLDVATTVPVSVNYATSDGTAIAGTDYTAASGTLNFAAGDLSKSFTVSVADNALYNTSKTINLMLSNPAAATLGTLSTAVLTIVDDDAAPSIKVIDDFTGSVAPLYNAFGTAIGFAPWGSENGNVALSTTSAAAGSGLALPGQAGSKSLLRIDYNIGSWGGFTHALESGSDWVSQDWSRYDGVSFWMYGNNTGGTIQTEIFDNQAIGSTGDSAERYYYRFVDNYTGWKFFRIPFSAFQRRTDYQPGGAPNDSLNLTQVSGYAFGMPSGTGAKTAYLADYSLYGDLSLHPLTLRVESAAYAYGANEGQPITIKVELNGASASPVTIDYAVTPVTAAAGINYNASNATGTLTFAAGETSKTIVIQTINDGKIKPTLTMKATFSNPANAALGWKTWATLGIVNTNLPDASLIDDFENGLPVPAKLVTSPSGSVAFSLEEILAGSSSAIPGQYPSNYVLSGNYTPGASFNRLFGIGRNLTNYNALRFWYKGSNSGQLVKVKLLDGQPDPGPSGWTLAWSDEFAGSAGTAPNATYWNRDIGGQGWGNNEWEYYTNSTDNAALDGTGNLVITAKPEPAGTTLECAYGPSGNTTQPCAYTSARLLTKDKIDFTYGRVEARLKIPYGQGIWPAFWMLGSDIESNPWPGSGEIDIMENIGKASEQGRLYGTIHGPGYSGGSGIGSGPFETGVTLHEDFHTYAIEWEPTQIRWYFDGYNYFTVNKSDVPAGREWVFNKPFFILLNVAVGGNWPGYPDTTTTFPQTMTVDYVRVYQGPDNAQRFESSFMDDSSDWKLVNLPFSSFRPSAAQPAGAASNTAPLLTNVRGYGFVLPTVAGSFKLDDVRGINLQTSQYLINGNFELMGANSLPSSWSASYITRNVDKLVSSTFQGGNYSLKFIGNNHSKALMQVVNQTGNAGDSFTLSAWSKALRIPTAGTYAVRVVFMNGSTPVGTVTANFAPGTHDWQEVTKTFTAPAAYTSVRYMIVFKKNGGTAWFDGLSLVRNLP
jgi:beta-glucanase (GH16 family)